MNGELNFVIENKIPLKIYLYLEFAIKFVGT